MHERDIARSGGVNHTVEADPDLMDEYTRTMELERTPLANSNTQLGIALVAFRRSTPDPAFVGGSLARVIEGEVTTHLTHGVLVDRRPRSVGQAFRRADLFHLGVLPTSVVAGKLREDGWTLDQAFRYDPGGWHDVGFGTGCPSRAYSGGSTIVGPDGQLYAVTFVDQSQLPRPATANGGDLPDDPADPGWAVVGYKVGTLDTGRPPSGWDRFWAFWAGTAGAKPLNPAAPPGTQGQLVIGPGGTVHLGGEVPPESLEIPEGDGPTEMPKDDVTGRYPGQYPIGASERGARLGGIGDLVGQIEQGVSLAATMGDGRRHAYQIVFAEAPDGRRRAYLKLFQVYKDDVNGGYSVTQTQGTVTADGTIDSVPSGLSPIRIQED